MKILDRVFKKKTIRERVVTHVDKEIEVLDHLIIRLTKEEVVSLEKCCHELRSRIERDYFNHYIGVHFRSSEAIYPQHVEQFNLIMNDVMKEGE